MDLTHWYTEAEAADKLTTNPRTFRRYMATRKYGDQMPEIRKRPRDGKKPENVYNPTDIDRLAVDLIPHIVPEKASKVPAEAIETVETQYVDRLMLFHKLYWTLAEASEVSGLPKSFLRSIAPQIAFKAGRSWRFPRTLLANVSRVAELSGYPLVIAEGQPPAAALPGSLL